MKDLKPVRGLRQLLELIAQGEHERQDFKYVISDSRKIARSISAFANNDGGRLIIGVRDNGTIAGVHNEEDLYMIEQAASRYCRPEAEVTFSAIKAGSGLIVYIASISRANERPISVVEENGRLQAYYRVKDENIVAHPLMVRAWRQAAANVGTVISLTDIEGDILKHLRELDNGIGTSHHDIALALHLSERACGDALVRLATLGLIDFIYDGRQFMIHVAP